MLIELDRVSLVIFIWINLEEAIGDLPPGPVSELFERFLAWMTEPGSNRRALPT